MDDPGACTEREITAPLALCRPDGSLDPAAVGWSRTPLIDCALPGRWGRRKRWDFWCVTAPGLACNLTYAHVDYLGTVDVWFRDLEAGDEATAVAMVPFGRGMHMHPRAGEGGVEHRTAKLHLAFAEEHDRTRLRASFHTSSGPFELDVAVHRPVGHEPLTVVVPWGDRRYQCTTKDVGRPAEGTIRWGDRTWDVRPDGTGFGALDFGRGRWRYRTKWNWGAAAGPAGDRTVGIQVGGKWTDGTGSTENAVVVDGRLSKISEDLVWQYDASDWMRPWRIRTPRSARVDLTFTPVHDKVTRMQAVVASSSVDQCFGRWAGTVVPDDGVPVTVDGLFGWAEEATWRW